MIEFYSTCPFCSKDRKKHLQKCAKVSVTKKDATTGILKCFHCGKSDRVHLNTFDELSLEYKYVSEFETVVHMDKVDFTLLSEQQVKYLSSRGLTRDSYCYEDIDGDIWQLVYQDNLSGAIMFPYYDQFRNITGAKFRTMNKNFWGQNLTKQGFWAGEIIPFIKEQGVCITEGEIDALSITETGVLFGVSLPCGANISRKLEILGAKQLQDCKTIYICTDNDEPGRDVRSRLELTFGGWRCRHIRLPQEFKDVNEFLVKQGKEALQKLLRESIN